MKPFILCALLFSAHSSLFAALKLPSFFADHMVLQREMPIHIWGTAAAGEKVTVAFAGQEKSAAAGAEGKWRVTLDKLPASSEPRELTISAGDKKTIADVLVGEVWLASGQSNMGFSLSGAHNAAEALASASDPQLRFFTAANVTAGEPQEDVRGSWQASDPNTAKGFSAVAYFFAKELRAKLGCPVGILHSSWGGTPAQAWLSIDALKEEPPFTAYLKSWDQAVAKHQEVIAHPELISAYQAALKQWQKEVAPAFNEAMKKYNADKSGPRPTPERPEPANPDPMAIPSPSSRPGVPSVIFNAKIAPLAGYTMRGVIWYQGEANGGQGVEYRTLLPRLIGDWRKRWDQGDLPFLIVQLAAWDLENKPAEMHQWPWLREAQSLTVKNVPKTGLAVAIDAGDPKDVHPKGKLVVGQRLALAARKIAYGENIVASGPIFRDLQITGSKVRARFDETGGGLIIGQAPWRAEGDSQWPKDKLIGFAIAGEDRVWHEADAEIDGSSVTLSNADVPKPVAIRYGWANAPRCNLYNREGLPASPFRTDDWPIPAAVAKPAAGAKPSSR